MAAVWFLRPLGAHPRRWVARPRSFPCRCPRSLTFAFAYNALAGADPHQRWRRRIASWARRCGCYDVLMSAQADTGLV